MTSRSDSRWGFRRRVGGAWNASRRRRAAATVELALLFPLLTLLLDGMVESGCAFLVQQAICDAARKGCATGTLPLNSNANITADVNAVLAAKSIDAGAVQITILVNGQAVDAITAVQGDQISVQVTVPDFTKVAWTSHLIFMSNAPPLGQTVVMMRRA